MDEQLHNRDNWSSPDAYVVLLVRINIVVVAAIIILELYLRHDCPTDNSNKMDNPGKMREGVHKDWVGNVSLEVKSVVEMSKYHGDEDKVGHLKL